MHIMTNYSYDNNYYYYINFINKRNVKRNKIKHSG